jgi:hypothetical protein
MAATTPSATTQRWRTIESVSDARTGLPGGSVWGLDTWHTVASKEVPSIQFDSSNELHGS